MRVAYLVEENEYSHTMLDAVFAECHSRWGGRFSLIVPCRSGEPEASFVPWLEVYDPDILYVYPDMSSEVVARLRERFGPAFLLQHVPHDSGERDQSYYQPELPFGMLTSLSPALQYARAFAPSSPQPMLIPDRLPNMPPDRFIDDNFGTPLESFHQWPLSDALADVLKPIMVGSPEQLALFRRGGPPVEMVPDATALLHTMAGHRNSFGIAQLSADAPRVEIAGNASHSLSIIVGDGFADRIYFWNERSLAPSYVGRGFVTLAVSPARLEHPEFFGAFVEFLKARNTLREGNRGPGVRLKSVTLDRPRLEEIRDRFQSADRWNWYQVADPVTRDGMVPGQRALREARDVVLLRGVEREPLWRDFPIEGSSIRPPSVAPSHLAGVQDRTVASQGLWALDLDIERSNNLSRLANEIHRWRLPLRLRMHGAFRQAWTSGGIGAEPRYSRSARSGYLVVYAGIAADPPEVTIPDDESAFRFALLHGNEWPPVSHRDDTHPHGPYAWVRPSDKGRYLAGTLRLFGGLQSAVGYLLHSFWKAVFDDLGGATGAARHDEIKRVLRGRLRDGRLESEEAWDRVARLVAAEAQRVRMPLRTLSFEKLTARHDPFLKLERGRFADHESTAGEERVASAKRSLVGSVQRLCARSVLYQGYEWRCATCFHVNWNAIGDLRTDPSCEVCGEIQAAPVDRTWDFRLSGFVREALKEHGVLALVWCLAQLHARARESFFFFGPHELYPEYPGEERSGSNSEADLICVVDRRIHLCEAKTSDREIEIESLVKVAKRLRPDVVTLAVMDEMSQRLAGRFRELQSALGPEGLNCELVTRTGDAFNNEAFLPS
jgi:hypothetical protein